VQNLGIGVWMLWVMEYIWMLNPRGFYDLELIICAVGQLKLLKGLGVVLQQDNSIRAFSYG